MTDGQQNLGGINLSLVAKCVRMHQVCWGESKIIAVKSAVLCEVFSSRTSKKQESRTLKLHRLYVSSPLKFGMSSRCSVAISPWVGSLNTALSPLLSSSSSLHLCLLGTRGSGSCWVAFPAVPGWKEPSFQDIHTQQQKPDSTGVSLVPLMLLCACCTQGWQQRGTAHCSSSGF